MTKQDVLSVGVELNVVSTKYADGAHIDELKQSVLTVINKHRGAVGAHITELTVGKINYDLVKKQVMVMVDMTLPADISGGEVVKAIDDMYNLVADNASEIVNG